MYHLPPLLPAPIKNIQTARHAVKRAAGAPYLAEVMADSGELYIKDNPGYVWVREILSDNGSSSLARGQAYPVRATGNFIPFYGARVRVVYDFFDGEWEIERQDFNGLVEQGINPAILNPNNPWRNQLDITALPPLRSYAVSNTNTATAEVGIKNLLYLNHLGVMTAFRLPNADRPDISDYAPSVADTKRLVHLWEDVDKSIAVSQSTPIPIHVDFSVNSDLAEVMNNPPHQLALPIAAWKIENGQTAITPGDMYMDTRQWLNIPQAPGFPNPVATNWLIPAGMTVTHAGSLFVTDTLIVDGSLFILDDDTRIASVGATFGDNVAGNYSCFEDDGSLRFEGNATVWDDLRVPGLRAKTNASAPDLGAFGPSGNLLTYRFDGAATTEQVYFTLQMPHSWKQGSTLYPHIHWAPTDTNSGNVKWQLEYSWANIEGTFGAPTTISVTDGADGTAWKHQIAAFSALSAAGKTISSMMVCRLFRNPTDGSDTYAYDAAFLEFDIHYQIDTIGSRQEYIK